jgi:hypothetical protein
MKTRIKILKKCMSLWTMTLHVFFSFFFFFNWNVNLLHGASRCIYLKTEIYLWRICKLFQKIYYLNVFCVCIYICDWRKIILPMSKHSTAKIVTIAETSIFSTMSGTAPAINKYSHPPSSFLCRWVDQRASLMSPTDVWVRCLPPSKVDENCLINRLYTQPYVYQVYDFLLLERFRFSIIM